MKVSEQEIASACTYSGVCYQLSLLTEEGVVKATTILPQERLTRIARLAL